MKVFPLKEYVLVQWDQYYPACDLGNIIGSYETLEEARSAIRTSYDNAKVYSYSTGMVVYETGYHTGGY
jgi:hypothetical protein